MLVCSTVLRSADALSLPDWIQSGIFLHEFVETVQNTNPYMSLDLHSPQCGQGGAAEQINIPLWWCGPGSNIYPVELLSVFLVLLLTQCPIWEHLQTKILYD